MEQDRNRKWCFAVLVVALTAATPCVLAQNPDAAGLQQNPTAALQAFEPRPDQPYQLGRGDEIDVEVLGRPELSGKHTVGPDGKITMPITGSIEVAGKTRDEAAAAVKGALSEYYSDVAVTVGVDHYTSNEILVLGAVEHPGMITFDRTPTLLEAVSRAGVPAQGAGGGQGASSTRPTGIPEEILIYRGNDQMATVELRELLDQGSPLANMRLKRDDIVYVAGKTSFISVFGQVLHPGNQHLGSTTTLADLLAEAGGPTEKAGKNPAIEIIHRNATGAAARQTILFKDLLKKPVQDVTLHSGDIVYLPQSGFNNVSYTFQQLSPLVNLFTVSALFGQSY
jgi:polysaccharide export outer membrane protein